MNTKSRRILALVPWILLPLLVAGYLTVWNELPARMATHFDVTGQPDGWMGRGLFLVFSTVFLLFELGIFTLILTTKYKEMAPPVMLIAFYFFIAGEAALLWQVTLHNIHGAGIAWLWVLAVGITASLVPSFALLMNRQRN